MLLMPPILTIDGVLIMYLTTVAGQNFWEVTLSLVSKHINALCAEDITYLKAELNRIESFYPIQLSFRYDTFPRK